MTINFYLDSKLSDNNEKAVICFVRGIEKQKTTYINTKIKINPEYWNNQKQNIRRNHTNSLALNSYIDKIRNEIQVLYLDYLSKNKKVDLKAFKEFLIENLFNKSEPSKTKSIYDVFDLYLKAKKNNWTEGSLKSQLWIIQHIRKYEEHSGKKVSFENMDLEFFDLFFDYGINHVKHTNNTIYKLIKMIKIFLKWAHERGYHNNIDFKKVKTKEEMKEVIYLTEHELMKLLSIDLSDNVRLSNIRDVFCLSCFTGVRYSDISKFDMNDVHNGIWFLRTQKTKEMLEIPLIEYALDILNKYNLSGLKLPVISNQKSIDYIRELCKLAGINDITKTVKFRGAERIETVKPKYEFIGTHTARRTFITLSLEKGMRPETVMAIVGHKDYKTMKRYISITSKVKYNEMMNVWKKID